MNARPTDRLAIAVAQLNPTVGDIAGNADKARGARAGYHPDGAVEQVRADLSALAATIAGRRQDALDLLP